MTKVLCLVSGKYPSGDQNGLNSIISELDHLYDGTLSLFYTDDIVNSVKDFDVIHLGGHSFGGDTVVRACRALQVFNKRIAKLCLFDPVSQSWDVSGNFYLPNNVDEAICMKKSWWLPPSSPIRNSEGAYRNVQIGGWFSHGQYPKIPEVKAKAVEFFKS